MVSGERKGALCWRSLFRAGEAPTTEQPEGQQLQGGPVSGARVKAAREGALAESLSSQYLRGGAQVNELMTTSTFLLWHLGQMASLSRSAR